MAVDLVTLAQVKSYIGEETAYADDELTLLLQAASGRIRRYIDPIEYTVYTAELHDGAGQPWMNLDHWPLKQAPVAPDVFTVAIDAVDVTSYVKWDRKRGRIFYDRSSSASLYCEGWACPSRSYQGFPVGVQNVSVSYVAGFGAAVPADVQGACLFLVRFWVKQELTARSVFYEGGAGSGPERAMPAQVREVIEDPKYRNT